MSPLSIAQYLPAEGRRFDVVVFDEASQIGTHDAIGAIARGNQVIIVGDSKQLPPTAFFTRNLDDDDALPDENDVQELESILEEALVKLPQQMLGWHYRSRHDSLIDFSNTHYYSGRLHVFPAAESRVASLGVKWHPVPDGVYTSGKTGKYARTNRREAEALVDHLCNALRSHGPDERSFGVVTFSIALVSLSRFSSSIFLRSGGPLCPSSSATLIRACRNRCSSRTSRTFRAMSVTRSTSALGTRETSSGNYACTSVRSATRVVRGA
jgi:hypothetical protein